MALERVFQKFLRKIEKTQYQTIQLISVRRTYLERRDKNRFRELVQIPAEIELSEEQVSAATSHAKQTLVVAGAGSGKTFVLVGRAKYLVESKRATQESVLMLAFNKEAAQELQSRTKASGVEVTAQTFHSFGNSVIKSPGARTGVAFGENGSVERFFGELLTTELSVQDKDELAKFFSSALVPFRTYESFNNLTEYASYVKSSVPITLNNEYVKSHGEWLIANYLWTHGIDYNYESLYRSIKNDKDTHRPDFRINLPENGCIWIEYFGISREGTVQPSIDSEKYRESIEWKFEVHARNNTKLIDLYYYDLLEGQLLSKLKNSLIHHGLKLKPKSPDEVLIQANKVGYQTRFLRICEQFLGHTRAQRLSISQLEQKAKDNFRNAIFVKVFEILLTAYEKELISQGLPDFAELIHGAADRIESGEFPFNFTHLLVDEFQDISNDRFRLIQAMQAANPELEVTYVGDDWQSIYRFGGSDVSIMRQVSKPKMARKRIDLTATYRLPQEIADISRRFILKNPLQLDKQVISKSELNIPGKVVIHWDTEQGETHANLHLVIQRIGEVKDDPSMSLRILARYVSNLPDRKTVENLWEGPISISTIHSAKGLEADYVIVMDMIQDSRGFPSSIEDDPVMSLVMPENDVHQHGEERRLFYVALTRAKRETHLISPLSAPSLFTVELQQDNLGEHVGLDPSLDSRCPVCKSGRIIRSGKFQGSFCSNTPFCSFIAPKCKECEKSMIMNGKASRYECSDHPDSTWTICPACSWGVLVNKKYKDKFTGEERIFMSCHTWSVTKCRGRKK